MCRFDLEYWFGLEFPCDFFFIFRSLGVLTELRLLGFSNIFFKDAMSLLRHYKEAMQRDVNEKVGCRDGQPIILSRNSVT